MKPWPFRSWFYGKVLVEWVDTIELPIMKPEHALRLGEMIHQRRTKLALSASELAARVGVNSSTIIRLEHGGIRAPRADKLARLAEVLGLTLADVAAAAGYLVSNDLPSFEPYLIAKYPELSEAAMTELTRRFKELRSISRDAADWESGGD